MKRFKNFIAVCMVLIVVFSISQPALAGKAKQIKPNSSVSYPFPVPLKNLANYTSLKKKQTDTEFQQAYNVALKIVTPLKDLSRQKQLIGIARALRYLFEIGEVRYSTSAPHYNDPYGYFVTGVASCAGCTRATGLCLRACSASF